MKSINLKNISYSYGETPIFTGLSFRCTENERLCILGENGAGKSTLLKIIAGIFTPDTAEEANGSMTGLIEKTGHVRTIYVAQEFPHEHMEHTVEEYITAEVGINLAKKVYDSARELGFDIEKFVADKKKAGDGKGKGGEPLCGSFSGGQQKILALSAAFAASPDIILLDEPENHIDIVSRVVLIRMLTEYRGGVIFISHDRLIIDSVATKVAELAHGVLTVSEGGYDDYIEYKMARLGGMQRAFDAETKRIKQLEQTVVILKQKAIRGKEISAYQRKLAELNELKKAHKENGRPDDAKTKIRIAQGGAGFHGGKLLLRVKDGGFRYPEAKADILRNINLEARTGTHIALLGRNGSGKSTFLKCLIGEREGGHPFTYGEVNWAEGIKFAYFDQHMKFEPGEKPIDIVMKKLNCFDEEARAALGAMRFDLKRMNMPVSGLSGGERMRLRFAIVFGQKPDFLILDEPTNHIDEVTWEILLEACKASKATILLVSHDYEFIQEFNPGTFWMIQDQSVAIRYKELGELLEEMGG